MPQNHSGEPVIPLELLVGVCVLPLSGENKKRFKKCEVAGCNTKKQSNGRCIRHGGGRRCLVEGCTRGAQTMGRCKRHGGGARCTFQGCASSSQGGGLCRVHGGGKLCTAPGCKKGAQRQGKCATHASRKCKVLECSSIARCKGVCRRHKHQAEAAEHHDMATERANQLDVVV
ncbi:WRKY transcription factor 19 [Phytophthora nicotianae]|nr:WRKY transcription factor 19 [Phytophthora nicotianae]